MEDTASSITELHIRDAGLVGAAAPSVEEVQPKVAAGEQDFAEFNSSKSRDANMPEAVQKHDARGVISAVRRFRLLDSGRR